MENIEATIIWQTENDERMLIWCEDTKDLIFIDDDKVFHIQHEKDIKMRFELVEWFDSFMPVYALAWVLKRLKGQI